MEHKQPHTPMQTDNTIAHGMVTNNIARKILESMDMRLHWIRFRATQGQFCHYLRAGATNLRDYANNHHAAIHHRTVRPIYLSPKSQLYLVREKTKIKEDKLENKIAARV